MKRRQVLLAALLSLSMVAASLSGISLQTQAGEVTEEAAAETNAEAPEEVTEEVAQEESEEVTEEVSEEAAATKNYKAVSKTVTVRVKMR